MPNARSRRTDSFLLQIAAGHDPGALHLAMVWLSPRGSPRMTDPHRYTTITDWQQLDPATGDAIRAFREREHANVSGDEATRRLDQVVAHVVDEHGDLSLARC